MAKQSKLRFLTSIRKCRFLRKLFPKTSLLSNAFVFCNGTCGFGLQGPIWSSTIISLSYFGSSFKLPYYTTSIIGFGDTRCYYLSTTVIMLNFCSHANILPSTISVCHLFNRVLATRCICLSLYLFTIMITSKTI